MTDEKKTPEQEIYRAAEARSVLDSPIFQEACRHIEQSLGAQRRSVPLTEKDMHTALIITEQLWGNLTDWLKQVIQTGKFAEWEKQRQKTLTERIVEGVRSWRG